MTNRLMGVFFAAVMIAANTALVMRYAVPRWLAGDPPTNDALQLRAGEARRTQLGIFSADGSLVGRNWTVGVVNLSPSLTVDSWTLLEPTALPNSLTSPRLRVHTSIAYQQDEIPEKIQIEVEGLPLVVRLAGEPLPPDFACTWTVGEQHGEFALPADSMRAFGDVLKPFDRLPGLFEGRRWRVNVFDALSSILPNRMLGAIDSEEIFVEVKATEKIEHKGETVSVFRVEAPHIVAWVATDGRVLRQQVEVPLLGTLTLIDEEWSQELFRAARDLAFSAQTGEVVNP